MKRFMNLLVFSMVIISSILWTSCSTTKSKEAPIPEAKLTESRNVPQDKSKDKSKDKSREVPIITSQAEPMKSPQNLGAGSSGRSR